jgi:predicted Ser/Thr protein kinase
LRVPWLTFFFSFPLAQLSENGVIGQGNFGVVYRGMCRGALVAVKIPKVEDLNEEKLEEFRAELK